MIILDLVFMNNFFAGKKVFITGHTGFKGSWLAFLLNELSAEVMGFALPPETTINHFDLLRLEKKIEHEAKLKNDLNQKYEKLEVELSNIEKEFACFGLFDTENSSNERRRVICG